MSSLTLFLVIVFGGLAYSKPSVKDTFSTSKHTASQCKIINSTENNVEVDCTDRNLTYIPILSMFATSLNLSNNNIESITDETVFRNLSSLHTLDLSDNPLELLPHNNIFEELTNLSKLYIRNTYLYKQKDLVLDLLLQGLNNLKHLSLTFMLEPSNLKATPKSCSHKFNSQPFGNIDRLHSIESLEIDSALLKFETNASIIYQTKSLRVINGFVCYYNSFAKEQFDYMPFIEHIFIESPFFIDEISDDFISAQNCLTELVIDGPDLTSTNAVDLIQNVTTSVSRSYNLTSLMLNDVYNHKKLEVKRFYSIYNLVSLTSLEMLGLVGNGLCFKGKNSGDRFPQSLKHLVIQENCMTSYGINNHILEVNLQLETVDASSQNNCVLKKKKKRKTQLHANRVNETDRVYSLQKLILTRSIDELNFGNEQDFFPNLTYLDLSINNKVPNNTIPNFFCSRRHNLRFLNLSNSHITRIEKMAFVNCSKLEVLDLSLNLLGCIDCHICDKLVNLVSLKALNLSSNHIKCSNLHMLNSMIKIERIDMSNNVLQSWDISILNAKNLTHINLSRNRIQTLSKANMEELDTIVRSNSIEIDLSENTLLCTCETKDFLQWMVITRVLILRRDEYFCTFSNGSVTSLNNLKFIVESLKSQCVPSKTALIVGMNVLSLCFLTSMVLVYKFRWRIQHWYYKRRFILTLNYVEMVQMFTYDVFISYSSDDFEIARNETIEELESRRDIKACIHERDFQPGEYIAENISRAIHSSKKIILFISKNFLGSEWCAYELDIALMEEMHSGRRVIMVIMVEDVPNANLPRALRHIVDTYTYLEYPKNRTEYDINAFWNKCAEFIQEN